MKNKLEVEPTFEEENACFECEYEEICPLEHGIYICLKDEAAKKTELKNDRN